MALKARGSLNYGTPCISNVRVIRVQGCETGWIIHGHTHSLGALRHPAPSSGDPVTLHDCLELCEGLTGSLLTGACLAVDVEFSTDSSNSSTVVCWLHTDLSRLTHKYHHAAVIQYVIVRCPQQQGSTPPTAIYSTATMIMMMMIIVCPMQFMALDRY